MILGIGTDIVSIDRIEQALSRRPALARRILTASEHQVYCTEPRPAAFLAKRFAAKEAIAKALGCGIGKAVSWQDLETRRGQTGVPEVEIRGNALQQMQSLGANRCHLSISDEVSMAVAFAVISAV